MGRRAKRIIVRLCTSYRFEVLLIISVSLAIPTLQDLGGSVRAQVLQHNEGVQITATEVEWVYVVSSRLNVRNGPSILDARITSFLKGTRLRVLSRKGVWTQVLEPDSDVIGWMHSDYLSGTPIAAELRPPDVEVRFILIRQSIKKFSGSCPCPYSVDGRGQRCGVRSAYKRQAPAPLCYGNDVTEKMIKQYRQNN